MKSITKRLGALLLALGLTVSLAACSTSDLAVVQSRFDEFTEQMFRDSIEGDFVGSLFFVEDPDAYGLDRTDLEVVIGPEESDEAFREGGKMAKSMLRTLRRFDRSLLTPEQQDSYDLIEWSGELNQQSYEDRFRYYGSYFSALSGVHTNLLTTLSELQVRDETDLQQLPELLRSIPDYIDSLLEYTRKQQEHQLLTIDFEAVIEVCDATVSQGENGTVLQNLLAQAEGLGLPEETVARYQEEIRTAYREAFLPSYRKIADTMRELQSGFNNPGGLAALPDSREYYELLFAAATALDESPEAIAQLAEQRLDKAISRLGGLAFLYPDAYNAWLEGQYTTPFTSYEEMLLHLDKATDGSFPAVGELSYVIDPIPADVANSGVAAYFINPAVDERDALRIRVNTEHTEELGALGTFTTLAHEGIPGHMYAAAYSHQNLQSDFRKVTASQIGYNEGYATYVELLSLGYLEELGIPEPVLKMERLNTEVTCCLVTMMDIAVNYEGLSREEFAEAFGDYFDPAFADYYYDMMRLEPTAYLSYYAGWLKLEQLREKAERDLGGQFTELGFHTAILQSGSVPYFIVERNVNAWIEATRAESAPAAGEEIPDEPASAA